jgi:phage terminase small subunit
LTANDNIQARVDELVGAAAEKAGVTVERIVAELAKVGFSDVRRA